VSIRSYHDTGFGRSVAWGVSLLGGYPHQFLPGLGRRDLVGLLRPVNCSIASKLNRGGFNLLCVHGYARGLNWVAMLGARGLGIPPFIRDEAMAISVPRSRVRVALKQHLFFPVSSRFCMGCVAIGRPNRDHCLQNGAPAERVFMAPYCVDSAYFCLRAEQVARPRRGRETAHRNGPGVGTAGNPVCFEVQVSEARQLAAYGNLIERVDPDGRPCLLFVGDGEVRPLVERNALHHGEGVRFLGFHNQSELPALFDLCNSLVLAPKFEPLWHKAEA
jgi:hypothetical protein